MILAPEAKIPEKPKPQEIVNNIIIIIQKSEKQQKPRANMPTTQDTGPHCQVALEGKVLNRKP